MSANPDSTIFEPPPRSADDFWVLGDETELRFQIDTKEIIRDMIARITAAEEGIREQVMVAWLREHGYTVTKEGS
jgi:hypothetical protein